MILYPFSANRIELLVNLHCKGKAGETHSYNAAEDGWYETRSNYHSFLLKYYRVTCQAKRVTQGELEDSKQRFA